MKLLSLLSLLIHLSSLGSSSVSPLKPKALITSVSHGGTKPFAPVDASKMFSVLAIASGASFTLAPSKSLQLYGVEKEITNSINIKILRRVGICSLNTGVYVYCLIFRKFNIRTPVAINLLMFVAETISSLFNSDNSDTLGPQKACDLSFLAITGSTAYAALNNLECFNPLFKLYSVYIGACGLYEYFFPKHAVETFLPSDETDEMTPGLVTIIGCASTVLGTLTASLAWGVAPVEAIGLCALASTMFHLKGVFASPEIEDLGMNIAPLAFWPIWNAAIAASILL